LGFFKLCTCEVSWKYFFRAIVWARKYGLRINLDLHAVPGSQVRAQMSICKSEAITEIIQDMAIIDKFRMDGITRAN
jgi:aryl-phospho-beta-D-glucosidase BglC (GH1 family)